MESPANLGPTDVCLASIKLRDTAGAALTACHIKQTHAFVAHKQAKANNDGTIVAFMPP